MSPGDALESRRPAAGVARGLGVMRSSVQAERRGLSRGQPVSMGDNVSGEGRAAHAGSAWQRHTTAPTRDEEYGCCGRRGQVGQPRAQKWAGCPALGRDTWAGRRCWRAPAAQQALRHFRWRDHGAVGADWHGTCITWGWTRSKGHGEAHGYSAARCAPVPSRPGDGRKNVLRNPYPCMVLGRTPAGGWRRAPRCRCAGAGFLMAAQMAHAGTS